MPENSPPDCGLIGARGLCETIGVREWNPPTSPGYASRPLIAYPNPFNPSTTISFRLDRDTVIELDIVNPGGQRIARLHRGFLPAGVHNLRWDGRDQQGRHVASGGYVAVLRSPAARYAQKLLLVK